MCVIEEINKRIIESIHNNDLTLVGEWIGLLDEYHSANDRTPKVPTLEELINTVPEEGFHWR